MSPFHGNLSIVIGRIRLKTWLAQTYAEGEGPTLNTVRRWARNGKLDPPASKDGRAYYVDPDTRYTNGTRRSLLERILAAEASTRST